MKVNLNKGRPAEVFLCDEGSGDAWTEKGGSGPSGVRRGKGGNEVKTWMRQNRVEQFLWRYNLVRDITTGCNLYRDILK